MCRITANHKTFSAQLWFKWFKNDLKEVFSMPSHWKNLLAHSYLKYASYLLKQYHFDEELSLKIPGTGKFQIDDSIP